MADPKAIDEKLFYSAAEFLDLEIPETNFYLEPFIPTEGIVLMFGKPSTYKTTIVFSIANAIATGAAFCGIKPDQGSPVLIIELDTPKRVVKTRFAGALARDSGVDLFFWKGGIDFVHRKSLDDTKLILQLAARHQERQYKVVFIDTLRRSHTLSEQDSDSVSMVYSAVEQLFPGAVIVFLHHSRKSGKDETEEMRREAFSGSMQWVAQAQVVVMVNLLDAHQSKVSLEIVKSQVSEIPKRPLRLQISGWDVRLESTAKLEGIGEILAGLPPGLGKREIDKALAVALGTSPRTAASRRLAWEKSLVSISTEDRVQIALQETCTPETIDS